MEHQLRVGLIPEIGVLNLSLLIRRLSRKEPTRMRFNDREAK